LLGFIKINKRSSKLKDAFFSNPGYFAYIHGDPSVHNFFIDKDFNIIIIDPSGIIKNTQKYIPIGFPACDYQRFIHHLKNFILVEKFDN